ncbi:alcohol dehydrogenase catalytic domain-containing protein [Zhihengliuella salsuginis]|uniref:Alcohol dehydrogenase n=1 Tax=Zhihengliuella salsuginis TaxID=578222 RepID=A0ABQ3GK13_9MICC|nr:alcohol dehydrogenase catalytic domain-containing protein [Zhihengliuella salsuginis]GHD10799.1 alcohol dehydrogenase [Zhihengliuella salsuginis]
MLITGAILEEIGRQRPYAATEPLRIAEVELAPPGPGELLVRIEAAGVCHSDLSVVNGSRVRPTPMLLGHEAAGRVIEAGAGVQGIDPGDRVVMAFLPRCGECPACATDGRLPCERGAAANEAGTLLSGARRLASDGEEIHHHLGVSAFATHAVVHSASAVRVDDDVPPEVAAVLGCAVLTGGGAMINAIAASPGESVMVVGLGGVGMAALLVAIGQGSGDVIAVDTLPEKLDLARQWGAHETWTPAEVAERGITADHVLECAGHPRAFETAFDATRPGGRTVTVGLPDPAARSTISPLTLTAQARTVIGSYLGSAVPSRDIPRFAQWWREGRLPVEKLISRRIGLDDLNTALDDLADGRSVRQVVLFD